MSLFKKKTKTRSNADQKRINVLKKRRAWLKKRIDNSDIRLTYDESEYSAIGWAINFIEEALPKG